MIHVCFGLYDKTGRYSKFTGTTMQSIFANTNAQVTVHILHDNTLAQDNIEKFSAAASRFNQRVNFYNVEALCADELAEYIALIPSVKSYYVSVATLYRLFATKLLAPDIEKIIYLDSDIVVNLDIAELWEVDLGDKILGVVPEILNRKDAHTAFALCRDGLINDADYFNAGVLLMNLVALRGEKNFFADWSKLVEKNPTYGEFHDQDALNCSFATRTVKLPLKFNRFVLWARVENDLTLAEKIYHFAGSALGMDMNDPFNRLWMDYFIQTPWFDSAAVGRLYEGFQKIQVNMKDTMIKLTAIMSGKARGFVVSKGDVDAIKKLFHVQNGEELIIVDRDTPRQEIFRRMDASRGKKIFFVFVPNFPFVNFEKLGFVYGKDFMNGIEFLSGRQTLLLNSHLLLQGM